MATDDDKARRMRARIWTERLTLPLASGAVGRIDALLREDETRVGFIRQAIDREVALREESALADAVDLLHEKNLDLQRLQAGVEGGMLDRFRRSRWLDISHGSLAIEGNRLSLSEMAVILANGAERYQSLHPHHHEILDHDVALRWVLEHTRHKEGFLTESDIRDLHKMALANSAPDHAGRYARHDRSVKIDSRRIHQFPSHLDIPPLMSDLEQYLSTSKNDPVVAFTAHQRLVNIHPFTDGNGRVARLLMNSVLVRGGYPPVPVLLHERDEYLAVIRSGNRGDALPFILFMLERLRREIDLHIEAVKRHPV